MARAQLRSKQFWNAFKFSPLDGGRNKRVLWPLFFIFLCLVYCCPIKRADDSAIIEHKLLSRWSMTHKFDCRSLECIRLQFGEASQKFELMREIVNPFSPWFFADFYIGNELEVYLVDGAKVLTELENRHTLKEASPCSKIHTFAVLFVQVSFFQEFVHDCLPLLENNIFLITGMWHEPAMIANNDTRSVLDHPKILHWFAQNPFEIHGKMTGFPYGILDWNLQSYMRALQTQDEKVTTLVNLFLSPTHPDREGLINATATKDSVDDYYAKMRRSTFVISPMGDRADAYRHWEAIGLGTLPICNCPFAFRQLFGDSMVFSDIDTMLGLIKNDTPLLSHKYQINKDLVSSGYWAEKIKNIMSSYLVNNHDSQKPGSAKKFALKVKRRGK